MDRFLLHVANAVALLFAMLALVVLVFALLDTLRGAHSSESYIVALAMVGVPYAFAGTLHRIVSIGQKD